MLVYLTTDRHPIWVRSKWFVELPAGEIDRTRFQGANMGVTKYLEICPTSPMTAARRNSARTCPVLPSHESHCRRFVTGPVRDTCVSPRRIDLLEVIPSTPTTMATVCPPPPHPAPATARKQSGVCPQRKPGQREQTGRLPMPMPRRPPSPGGGGREMGHQTAA
jgi:hypothetical protein